MPKVVRINDEEGEAWKKVVCSSSRKGSVGLSFKRKPQAGGELGERKHRGEHRGLITGENQRSYIYTTNERRMVETRGPPRKVVHTTEPWYWDTEGNQAWSREGRGIL